MIGNWRCVLIVLMGCYMASCNTDVLYEQMEDVDVSGWEYDKPINFSFTAPDTVNTYNLIFDIRITSEYGYRNLWLFVETTYPDGLAHIDTINCPMAYPDGRWIGSGVGGLIDNSVLIHQQFRFVQPGEYKLKIKHGMRNDALPFIEDLGMMLKVVKN